MFTDSENERFKQNITLTTLNAEGDGMDEKTKSFMNLPYIIALATKYAVADDRVKVEEIGQEITEFTDRTEKLTQYLKRKNKAEGIAEIIKIMELIQDLVCNAVLEGFINGYLTARTEEKH